MKSVFRSVFQPIFRPVFSSDPVGGNYLITEASDRLDTENGDNLITES